ncbi:NADH:flavin oxidoreductase/NADH oxidase [Bdellovibrio sp. HCB337]|uniref:NADH:flavin oxidoreductase/NADH oxidase n=1 Tax=Bdellovibrio sp. HCB337 TaxID=3394358 RepID=UPI0039A501C3
MSELEHPVHTPLTTHTTKLFASLRLRDLQIKNRIFMSPMCQYSAREGVPNNWHLVHLGSRAVGGAGLVMVEATAVKAIGRISPGDLGIWNDEQMQAYKPITSFLKEHGAVSAIQLAHAGRKASTAAPWKGGKVVEIKHGGWIPEGPSPVAFSDKYVVPHEMTKAEIESTVDDFVAAAKRSLEAGFEVVELHMAHGYLMHEFLSPLSNQRQDEFGGTLENRMRFPLMVAEAVRKMWPQKWPVFVRISATDWVDGGWDLSESIEFVRKLKALGIDFIDCSSGGAAPYAKIPTGPGYQVAFAAEIRESVQIATGAVGMITDGHQAEKILQEGHADAILLGRELLRDPYFPLNAARALGVDISWPAQYQRGKP